MPDANNILWVDDEIDHLESHMVFLRERGYAVSGATSGDEALELIAQNNYDLVLLDEMMTGRDGLSTLEEIKHIAPNLPVVMVTKSEEEDLMEQAIGKKIDDYLTKPVNPSQILSVIKRHLHSSKIQTEHLSRRYAADIAQLQQKQYGPMDWPDWIDVHLKLTQWDLDIDRFRDLGLDEIRREHQRQWSAEFGKYVEKNYVDWVHDAEGRPPLSTDVVQRWVAPHLKAGRQVFFFVIDCMSLDHWLHIEPEVAQYFNVRREHYFSILPSATPFSRNAIFSGLFPEDVKRLHPELWQIGSKDEYSRNRLERQLLDEQLARLGIRLKPEAKYVKVLDQDEGDRLAKKIGSYSSAPLLSVVYNFIDNLAHGRSESELLRELAPDQGAFRDLMKTWFTNSSWFKVLQHLARRDCVVVVTSDHGSILGTRGTVARARKDSSTNLRYKYGDNLNAEPKESLIIRKPEEYRLPTFTISTSYLIAKEDFFFVYPTQFNEYQRRFAGTFQHGGVSLPEMVLPVATLEPK
jgi:DNA-binding response OmpR family regulator